MIDIPALKIWHPFTHLHLDPAPEGGPGERLLSLRGDGRPILDAISSWWVNLHGHCHPHISRAIAAQTATLGHVLLAGFSHPAVEQLSQELRRFLSAPLEHVFYSDNGSTAVEVALKIAVQYWRNVGRPEKKRIVALDHAYHGDTAGAMSVGAKSGFNEAFASMCFPVQRVQSAYCLRCPVGKRRSECSIDCLASLSRMLESNSGEIAAVIVEPLLPGSGRDDRASCRIPAGNPEALHRT